MSVQVGLLDNNPIIEKTISHCLYYFVPEVHSFNSLDATLIHFENKKLDIIFVDFEMKEGKEPLIHLVQQRFKSTPIVLLYREELEEQVKSLPETVTAHRAKKPVNPKQIREFVKELVPEVRDSILYSFLKFPESELNIKGVSNFSQKSDSPSSPQTKQIRQENTKSTVEPSVLSQVKGTSTKAKTKNEDIPALRQTVTSAEPAVTQTAFTTPTQKIDKEKMNLDENTNNDLAPATMKPVGKKSSSLSQGQEKELLNFFMKYKDSLEFEKLMEKVLAEHAKTVVSKILQSNQLNQALEKPLKDFTQSDNFIKLVEKEISSYLKKELAIVIKSIVEKEIKKIVGV